MRANFDVPIFKTIFECSKITGLAKYHIRQIVLSGKVRFIRAGTKYLVNLKSLIDYLNDGEKNPSQEEEKSIRKINERRK